MGVQIKIGEYLLCEDGVRSASGAAVGPLDGSGRLAPGTEDREYIGAAGVVPEHVGCDRKALAFSVSRVYDSPAAAFTALAAMLGAPGSDGAVPREGALTMTDGQATSTLMTSAALKGMEYAQTGCALAIRYTFEGY